MNTYSRAYLQSLANTKKRENIMEFVQPCIDNVLQKAKEGDATFLWYPFQYGYPAYLGYKDETMDMMVEYIKQVFVDCDIRLWCVGKNIFGEYDNIEKTTLSIDWT